MNNEIETLTPENDSIEVLDTNELNQNSLNQDNNGIVQTVPEINNSGVNQTLSQSPSTNQVINPNAYHPSLSNNQNNIVDNPQTESIPNNNIGQSTRHINFNRAENNTNNNNNNNVIEPQNSVQFTRNSEQASSSASIDNRTVLAQSVVILIISLIVEFIAAPHAMVRLLMYAIEKLLEAYINGGSEFLYNISSFVILTLALGILIFAFVFMIYSIYNVISRKNALSDVINKIIKIFLFSFLIALVILLFDKLFGTSLSDFVLKITTFNYKTVNHVLESYI